MSDAAYVRKALELLRRRFPTSHWTFKDEAFRWCPKAGNEASRHWRFFASRNDPWLAEAVREEVGA